jgi:hypothetical protein
MKLAAIFCVWSDCNELLGRAIDNIRPVVDGVIVVYSNISNHGNSINFPKNNFGNCILVSWEPNLGLPPHPNESAKRNFGLDRAKELGYTHFINLDADEFYDRDEFENEKSNFTGNGSVCRIKTYFKSPTLTVGFDHTLVPFIHKLNHNTKFVLNSKTYPFTYDSQGNAHIDPTRRLNYTNGIQMAKITMHHYSYVRANINLKINNSSANLRRSSEVIQRDLKNAQPGYFCELYQRELIECENYFNIPEL